ncbi:MAG: hypothetical protein UY97_C0008G0023 [Parcubacteria group bacterium GW2011_GWB1_57_6]|nr:MAG: hypothetical protein UY93_C0002G0332 [Parcubacteria group bacterium GW2011_GWA1_56_13]KKW46236.1 MAG: hypothetical protein UY97_C0008G0023 [Parcubacteria group bacterium GW2011_GWB1_57_6]
MRTVANPSEIPNLFSDEGYSGEKFLTEFSAQEIVRMEMEKGEATWPGVKKLIEEEYPWRKGFVVEGVAILPHLVARDFSNTPHVKAVFLVDEDADRMREVIFKRGLWDGARTYPDEVKEKEVEWATLFSHLLKADVEKYGYPWVEVRKQEDDTQAVLRKLDLG